MSKIAKTDIKLKLDVLEKAIEQCRLLYELYFSGIEKREPHWHKQDVVRQFTVLRREKIGSAVDRFRLQGLQQRFNTFSQYWNRVNLQREKGTYFKDKQRARRRLGFDQQHKPKSQTVPEALPDDTAEQPTVFSIQEAEGGADLNRLAHAAAAAAAAAERSERAASSLSDDRCQKIYRNYIAAKQKCGESTAGVSYDSMVRSIRKQVPKLQERGYSNIDFKVVIRDGKAALKPVAKKG